MLAFVLAMSVTMALVPMLTRLAGRLNFMDAPGPRKVHQHPIPRVGGLAMVAGAVLPLLYWAHGDPHLPAFLAAAAVLVGIGVWDDRAELGYLPKFGAQLAAAIIVVTWGGVLIHSIMLADRFELSGVVAAPFTVLFLIGVTNAINLADGLDGLAGGTTLLSCCALALLAFSLDDRFVAMVSIIVAGSILGFLRFNTYPARIFMGDGGSQYLGFTVAVLAVVVTQRDGSPISAALPLLLLGLPIIDTLSVMTHRLAEGRSPFSADKTHIHHRLLALGFEHYEAVIIIYLAQAALFVAAWYLRYESDLVVCLVFALSAAAVLGILHAGAHFGWRWRRPSTTTAQAALVVAGPGAWRRFRAWLPAAALATAAVSAVVYAARIAWTARPIPTDVGWLATLLAVVLVLSSSLGGLRPRSTWLAHVSLYVAVVIVVYLDVTGVPPLSTRFELIALTLLAGSVMLSFRLTAQRRFQLTPLDFIIVFFALALPNLPGSVAEPQALGVGALKLAVLFYAVELMMSESTVSRLALQSTGVVVLAVIAARSLV